MIRLTRRIVKTTEPPTPSPYAPDLAQVRAWLETMIAASKFVELVLAVVTFVTRLCAINAELTKQLAHLRRKRPKSETLARLERQLLLPHPEFGVIVRTPRKKSNDKNETTKPAGKGGGGRHKPADHLERVEVYNRVPPAERICPVCGSEMKTVGHSRCEIIDVVPAKVFVHVRLDERVACPKDDAIVSAKAPPAIVERGKLSDGLLVEALADKYLEHMPVERQCSRLQRYGVHIAPSTLGRGVCATIDLLAPVARLIQTQTRGPGLLGTDATLIPILDPATIEGIRNGTMWCWTNVRWVSFVYASRGDSDSVREFLGGKLAPNQKWDPGAFARTVQCDGTSITTFIERAGGKRPGCMAHARRRFVEAARLGDQIALEGLAIIARLFAVERASLEAGESAGERRSRRQRDSRPVIDELREWVDAHRATTPPKTPLGRALGYLHRQWPRLILFLDDGNLEATNNRRERELRRLVLGRKNWLFTWLDVGGERTANILSIVATCIAHDVNPRAYLHAVTKLIVNGWPQSKLRELLPDRILASRPELYVGDPALLSSSSVPALGP